jgi:DMSO reductase anchor subunit
VARRHAEKLRGWSAMLLFLLPLAGMLLLLLEPPHVVALALAAASVLSAAIGVFIERWLFFAEAEHVVVVYYRGGAA